MKKNNVEQAVFELILFLQTWDFWTEIRIVAMGNAYVHSYDKKDIYRGFENIQVYEGVDPKSVESGYEWDKEPEDMSDDEIKNFFRIIYDNSTLFQLLFYGEYNPERERLSDEAWKYLFQNTSMIEDYISTNYDIDLPDNVLIEEAKNYYKKTGKYEAYCSQIVDYLTEEFYRIVEKCENIG